MLKYVWLRAFNFGFPERGDIFLITLTDSALVIVTEALLGPEGALSFEVDLVCAEEGCLLQLGKDGIYFAVELL